MRRRAWPDGPGAGGRGKTVGGDENGCGIIPTPALPLGHWACGAESKGKELRLGAGRLLEVDGVRMGGPFVVMRRANLEDDGFEIHRRVISDLGGLIDEAESLAVMARSACVRDAQRSQLYSELARSSALVNLLPPGLFPVRFILFDKTAAENWPVSWHQDLSIAVVERRELEGYRAWTVKNGVCHVQPPVRLLESMVTVRLHLDDAPASNGALRVVPGSHALGRLPSGEVMREVGKRGEVVCACAAGDVLLIKPLLLHASSRSKQSTGHRRVIHIEYARREDLDARLGWHLDQSLANY